tara:strand:- start:212 stop:409 length:198 start_codon:yes stop_codon:yes gene_type:complete
MTKGDIIQTPTGRIARYEGGTVHGAQFVYVDEKGEPRRDPRDRAQLDTFCLRSIRLLTKLQPELA